MSPTPWLSDAAARVADTDKLLVLEGFLDDQPVYLLCTMHIVAEAGRIEWNVLAVLADVDTASRVRIDGDGRMYKLTEVARTEGGDALSTTERLDPDPTDGPGT